MQTFRVSFSLSILRRWKRTFHIRLRISRSFCICWNLLHEIKCWCMISVFYTEIKDIQYFLTDRMRNPDNVTSSKHNRATMHFLFVVGIVCSTRCDLQDSGVCGVSKLELDLWKQKFLTGIRRWDTNFWKRTVLRNVTATTSVFLQNHFYLNKERYQVQVYWPHGCAKLFVFKNGRDTLQTPHHARRVIVMGIDELLSFVLGSRTTCVIFGDTWQWQYTWC